MQADIVYKRVGGQSLRLDLHRRAGRTAPPAPLLVWIHGGGYVQGTKDGAVSLHGDVLMPLIEEHGFAVAAIDYRLCTPAGPHVIDATIDCKDAVRYLTRHANELQIDASRVVVMGSSAGGGLGLTVALSGPDDFAGDPALSAVRPQVRGAVSWSGVTDFTRDPDEFEQGAEKGRVLFGPNPTTADFERVSAVTYLRQRPDRFPLLLVHGTADTVVPFGQSAWLKQEADRLGWPVELISIANLRHGFQSDGSGPIHPPLSTVWRRTIDFVVAAAASPRQAAHRVAS